MSALVILTVLVVATGGQAQLPEGPLLPPSPPENVRGTVITDGVLIAWDRPAFDGGSPALTYRVYRDSTLLADGLSTTTYVDETISMAAAGAAAQYTVTAVNAAGESAHGGGPCTVINPPGVDPGN